MSVKKFKFVSPGIFVNEIDNSQLPNENPAVGPVIIGRTERGPALRPVRIESFSEFVNVFGNPLPGNGSPSGDVWRDGNGYLSPTYASYAAQAYLRNNSPATVVRLLGAQAPDTGTAGVGKAGWSAGTDDVPIATDDGGAWGLFMFDLSGDIAAGTAVPNTGTLAAIFYTTEGSVTLSGSYAAIAQDLAPLGGEAIPVLHQTASTCALIKSDANNRGFTAEVRDSADAVVHKAAFNFSDGSSNYIRKVFNTDPTMTNSTVTTAAGLKTYWLGETYDRHLISVVTGSTARGQVACVLPLNNVGADTTLAGGDFKKGLDVAKSGWVFSQDLQTAAGTSNGFTPINTGRVQQLLRFNTLSPGDGDWSQKNLKISIQDIKVSSNLDDPYGTFTVVVRKANDSDNAVRIVERFSECNLNPNSIDYVGNKIGDKYVVWDDDNRLYREYGTYNNQSKFIRVEINTDVNNGTADATLLPFGFFGPPKYTGFDIYSGSTAGFAGCPGRIDDPGTTMAANLIITGSGLIADAAGAYWAAGPGRTAYCIFGPSSSAGYNIAVKFPEMTMRLSASAGNLTNPTDAYFGLDTSVSAGSKRFGASFKDLVAAKPAQLDSYLPAIAAPFSTEYSTAFTLDDLVYLPGKGGAVYHQSGSRALGTSMTAVSSSYEQTLNMGYDRFTLPTFGGFDGVDITERDAFRNTAISTATAPFSNNNYEYNTIKRAIDAIADPEVVEMNVATIPGIYNENLTTHLVSTCEDRADALAIIDLEGDYKPSGESNESEEDRKGNVATTLTNLKSRAINSSYGCAYYPWVQIRDNISSALVFVPPSVPALGVFGSSEATSELWFAPAGFNRGGLTEGSAGLPVLNVLQKLTSKDRDKLYEQNVNPIASFPSEGIVVFGQKTLQVSRSALDRINVRRLLIYLKKEISRISATLLFDQNVQATWDRFLAQVNPFLASVKARLGLMDYKVLLDKNTTTPDLIDRNIMYAKILLKPAKAIEFIALDFVITDSGASFED